MSLQTLGRRSLPGRKLKPASGGALGYPRVPPGPFFTRHEPLQGSHPLSSSVQAIAMRKVLPRDIAILRLLARYRIAVYPVLGKLFFDGGDAGRVMGILARDGLVSVQARALKNNLSYVTLSSEGCSVLGIPPAVYAKTLSPTVVSTSVGVLWFCTMGGHERHRLSSAELNEAFGSDKPPENNLFVCSRERGYPAIFRVIIARGADHKEVQRIGGKIRHASKNYTLKKWVDAGDLGFAVLVPWRNRILEMREALLETFGKQVALLVDAGPTSSTLCDFVSDQ